MQIAVPYEDTPALILAGGRPAEAILLRAAPLYSKEAIIHFNLACYAARLGRLKDAEARLARAIELDDTCKLLALEEPDLEPIW